MLTYKNVFFVQIWKNCFHHFQHTLVSVVIYSSFLSSRIFTKDKLNTKQSFSSCYFFKIFFVSRNDNRASEWFVFRICNFNEYLKAYLKTYLIFKSLEAKHNILKLPHLLTLPFSPLKRFL